MKSRWLILYIYMYVHYWHTSTRVSIQAAKLAKTCVGEEIIANRIYLTCNRYDNDLYKRKYIAYIKCKITLQFAVNIKYPSPNINVDIIVFENCISYQAALRAVIESFTSKHEDGKSEDQLTQSMCFPH